MLHTRRTIEISFLVTLSSAVAALLFIGNALLNAEPHEKGRAALIGAFAFCLLLLASLLCFLLLTVRTRRRQRTFDSLIHALPPFWKPSAAGGLSDASYMPKSIHHLLQSLDVQRNIMKRCFEHAPFGVLLIGTHNTIIYTNPLFLQMSGYRPDDLAVFREGRLHDLFAAEDEQHPLCVLLDRKEASGPEFCFMRAQSGEQVPVLLSGFPLTDMHASGSEGYILFVRDASPSHQLKILQQQFSFLLNSLTHGVVVTDLALKIAYVNDAYCALHDCEQADLVGQPVDLSTRSYPDEAESLSYRLCCLALETDDVQTSELTLPLEAGAFRHYQITATPVKDLTATNIGVLLLWQDRTSDKELHETIRRHDQLETVSQMAASIAHEVRNPMTSVQGFLQLMSREIDPAHPHAMYLNVMEEDLKRINTIITEYLNFSKMGSDSLEDVWIGTLLHNTYTLLLSEANLKGIQLDLSLSGNDLLLVANPNRLKQVLINLARNAMEAMDEQGGGVLTLALETTDDEVCLMVKDTGPGIASDDLTRIFSPFYTTKKTGTGLGLFISKKIIDEHNGQISVQTELNRGTIFRLSLPKRHL